MKKITIVFLVAALLCFCSCSDDVEVTDNNVLNNSADNSSSDTTSVISDFELPERDDPTESSTTSSSNTDIVTSHNPEPENENLTVTRNLTLEVEKPSYKSTATMLNLILHNERGVFNYYTDFFLQRYENGKWEYYTTLTDNIEYKYNIATSDGNVMFITYDLRKNYKTPLPTGTYRFIQESDSGKLVSNSFKIVDNMPEENAQAQ